MKTILIRRSALSLLACGVAACAMFCVVNYPAAVDASASARSICSCRTRSSSIFCTDAQYYARHRSRLMKLFFKKRSCFYVPSRVASTSPVAASASMEQVLPSLSVTPT